MRRTTSSAGRSVSTKGMCSLLTRTKLGAIAITLGQAGTTDSATRTRRQDDEPYLYGGTFDARLRRNADDVAKQRHHAFGRCSLVPVVAEVPAMEPVGDHRRAPSRYRIPVDPETGRQAVHR